MIFLYYFYGYFYYDNSDIICVCMYVYVFVYYMYSFCEATMFYLKDCISNTLNKTCKNIINKITLIK